MKRSRRHLAVGDPQAPFSTLISILEAHGAIGAEGMLRADVALVSMGDHFDWGPPEARARATDDGLRTVAWLASHPAEQVVMLLGNHDLARVAELAHFDDETFARARAEADVAYRRGDTDRAAEAAFLERHPFIATAEVLARDYSCFSLGQRVTVSELLRSGRFKLAHEHAGLLLHHAGMTVEDLEAVGASTTSAADAATRLNAWLRERVAAWDGGPLDLSPLYRPGTAKGGEARGALAHRPADPAVEDSEKFTGPPRRRFDPRTLPSAFPQVIGHIRDKKCRELMPSWCDGTRSADGPVRSLALREGRPSYRSSCQVDACLYFIDNGMSHASPQVYELFDLDTRRPASKAGGL